ncbi:Ferredoxin reductase OS=Streptomyces glaucescens OX=1907 GN=SGLAU_09590 PE=4 SV=1 [Streptomyces glaucescens]
MTVVEAAARPLAGALPAEVAAPMAAWYADAGAELRTRRARGARRARARWSSDDGTRLPAGAVVVGIGARPATAWLAGSGIELGPHGEVVADAGLRTSAPDVYAVGDCASFPSGRYGERLLVHHWDNALQGPRTVAANIVGTATGSPPPSTTRSRTSGPSSSAASSSTPGTTRPPTPLLWRGDPSGPAWSVCWLRERRLVALLAVGRPGTWPRAAA